MFTSIVSVKRLEVGPTFSVPQLHFNFSQAKHESRVWRGIVFFSPYTNTNRANGNVIFKLSYFFFPSSFSCRRGGDSKCAVF